MTYKIKSLLYFFAFLISSTIYYGVEQYEEFQKQILSEEVAETNFADSPDPNEISEEALDPTK